MVGTNDAINKKSKCILEELLQLEMFLRLGRPNCEVIISCQTFRFDEPNTRLTLYKCLRQTFYAPRVLYPSPHQ